MNQSIDISDFSQILASLKGKSAAQKTGGKTNTQDDFASLLKGISTSKGVKSKSGLGIVANTENNDDTDIECCGKEIIESLKKALIGKGITNFETGKVDMEALSKIENLLLKSGADPDKVSSLISSLKAKMQNGAVSLKEVFAGLNTMEDNDFFKEDFFLEISAQPYLQTLLTQMGIDAETVKNMLENSTDIEKGINLGKLVKALKSMENANINSAALFSDDSKGAASAADILDQINLKMEKNDRNERMSLGRLIAILENNAANSAGAASVSSATIKNAFSKAIDAVKTSLTSADPAGSSRAMLARMQLKEDKKTGSIDQNTKNDKTASQKNIKNIHEKQANQSQTDKAANAVKTELSAGNSLESGRNGNAAKKTEKSDDRLEFAARIFDMISGKETASAETAKAEQNHKPLPVYVANQATKGILRAINSNEKEIVIQIKPAELGRMQIKIENSEAGIKVQIIAEKNMTSEILNSSKNDLTAFLAESGIKIEKLDIQLAFNFDQTMSSFKDQAQQESGKRRNKKNNGTDSDDSGSSSSGSDEDKDIDDRVSLTA